MDGSALVVKEKNVTVIVNVQCEPQEIEYIRHTASLMSAYLAAPTRLKRIQHIMSADMGVQLAKLSLMMEEEGGKDGSNSTF